MRKTVAILAGEPKSINSEIIAKSWKLIKKNQKKNIFVIGNFSLLKKQLHLLKLKIPIKKIDRLVNINSEKYLKILDIPFNFKNAFETTNKESSKYILKCFNIAHYLAEKKLIKGFVNCPINKRKTFKKRNIGVTEFLAKKNKIKNKEVMLIFNEQLSVVPLTTHINVKSVAKKINHKYLKNKIINLNNGYYKIFRKRPIIAVLGLNPHNGELRENSEEKKIIIPVIKQLREKRLNISGPFSADSFFSNKRMLSYDVVVGMYHDQVLTPFKTLYKFDACNVTLGLKYIRVSPDHGVAEDIVGLKKANPTSLIRSINFILNI